jgi:hypothetical protein
MVYSVIVKEQTFRVLTEPAEDPGGANTNFIEKATFAPSEYETICDGEMAVEGSKITLSYEPTDQISVEISFSVDEPKLISLQRHSESMPALNLVLEEGVRRVCLCKNKNTAIEMMTRAQRISNTFLRDGCIEMDYIVEVNGIRAEKTKMKISLIKS